MLLLDKVHHSSATFVCILSCFSCIISIPPPTETIAASSSPMFQHLDYISSIFTSMNHPLCPALYGGQSPSTIPYASLFSSYFSPPWYHAIYYMYQIKLDQFVLMESPKQFKNIYEYQEQSEGLSIQNNTRILRCGIVGRKTFGLSSYTIYKMRFFQNESSS